MVESIGKKLAHARHARGLTLEEAAMETRIRAKQLSALETDDYSSFANNTYARGFLLMYGKYLGVDVRAYARELEAGNPISISDYQYLNAEPDVEESRPARRSQREPRFETRRRPSLAPLIAFVILLAFAGFGAHLYYQAQRLEAGTGASPTPTPAPDVTEPVEAPSSKPAISSAPPVPATSAVPVVPAAATPLPTAPAPSAALPGAAPGVVAPAPTDRQFLSAAPTPAPVAAGIPAGAQLNELVVEPLKKTWIRIRRDDPAAAPIFEGELYANAGVLKIPGNRFWVEIREANAVTIRKNGQPLAYQPPGISIQ